MLIQLLIPLQVRQQQLVNFTQQHKQVPLLVHLMVKLLLMEQLLQHLLV
jgi:hypothetical protein